MPLVPLDDQAFLRTLTVLYVEDEAVTRHQLSELLRPRVGTLVVANDGQEALTQYRDRHPDLVLTDLQLPGIDGFSLAHEIVSDNGGVPVLVTTSYNQPEYLLRAIELGVAKYLIKPVSVANLETALLHCAHRLNLEAQHRALRARLDQVVDASTDGFWERDLLTREAFQSARFNELLGLRPTDTVVDVDEFMRRIHPDDLERIAPRLHAADRGELDRFVNEFRARHHDGSWKWLRSRGKVVTRGPDGTPLRFAGAVTDITAQKVAEAELRTSEARFRALAERSPVGVFETDLTGANTYLNSAGLQLLGVTEEAAKGMGWLQCVHPDDRAEVAHAWGQAVQAQRSLSRFFRFSRPDGRVVLVRAEATPVRDAAGRVTEYVGVLVDQTEHQALTEERALSARLSSMATMIAGVAHETNNPLTAVIATQSWVAQEVRKLGGALRSIDPLDRERLAQHTDEIVEALADAARASDRIAAIVRDLTLVGKPAAQHGRVRLAAVAQRAIDGLPPALRAAGALHFDDQRPPDLLGSAVQLEQVVTNLVTNALQAVASTKGAVRVRVGPGATGFAALEVADTGPGLAPNVADHMFEPFFTTRDVGQGMGLGLTVARSIVQAHGGTIEWVSSPGQGATFRVELPALVERGDSV